MVYMLLQLIESIEKQGNKKIEFWGNSVIFDPSGKLLKKPV